MHLTVPTVGARIGDLTLSINLMLIWCHRMALVIAHGFGAGGSKTVEPILTAADSSEPHYDR